jgi:hypothetical protein
MFSLRMQRTHSIRIPQSIVEVTAPQCPLEQSPKKTLVTLQRLSCAQKLAVKKLKNKPVFFIVLKARKHQK